MAPGCAALIFADGDLPALLACAAASREREPDRTSVAWIPAFGGPGGVERVEAARRHAELYGLETAEDDVVARCGGASTGWDATFVLLRACRVAGARGLRSVVWPVAAGPELDLDRTAREVDRALLVTRLSGIDLAAEGSPGVQVRTPYADFTDDQVADLVLDMDLPVWSCWWWEPRSEEARRTRERWGRALARVGWLELPVPGPVVVGQGPVAPRAASST